MQTEEVGLTLAEVVRDQKHILRTGYFLSAQHFSEILLPSGQEALFILLMNAGICHYIAAGRLTIILSNRAGTATWRSCNVES